MLERLRDLLQMIGVLDFFFALFTLFQALWRKHRSHRTPTRPTNSRIPDDYNSQERTRRLHWLDKMQVDAYKFGNQATNALAWAQLKSSNLIVGVDFTKSNDWTGNNTSFNHQSLHRIGGTQNPYEQAISIIGRRLADFEKDDRIPFYGFGDASTRDQAVFSFNADDRPCNGFKEALSRYREIAPRLRSAGPTSFAPIIEMAMTIVEKSGGQFHVLLIIADGQVTRSLYTPADRLSFQEQNTIDAIVRASEFPLSIILVGVGDGPWDRMNEFKDNIPARQFDNFQFLNFTDIMSKRGERSRRETEFGGSALREILIDYRAAQELGIVGHPSGKNPASVPCPPPVEVYGSTSRNNQACPNCHTNLKDMALGCGHLTCCECGQRRRTCPICHSEIVTRIKLRR